MEVVINVSLVNITSQLLIIHCSTTRSPFSSVPLPPPPADKLVIPHQFCAGIWRPAHEDLADIPHLLQFCITQESELHAEGA